MERKLSLWSLSVTKAGALAMRSTLSLIVTLVDMILASRLIEASSLGGTFEMNLLHVWILMMLPYVINLSQIE